MQNARLLSCLDADYRRIREVAPGHLAARVPSCPDWTVADLVRHVAQVYLHKVEMMRHGEQPAVWPPAGFSDGDPVELLDRAYAELKAEFTARKAADPAPTWHDPDQTVGFWIRRMAQETVIHRIDAELGAGAPVAPVPADLAIDGVDELLQIFVGWAFSQWPEDFAAALERSPGHTFLIQADKVEADTPAASWLVRTSPERLTVEGGPRGDTPAANHDVTVSGPASSVLRWAWNRTAPGSTDDLTFTGNAAALGELRSCITEATQ